MIANPYNILRQITNLPQLRTPELTHTILHTITRPKSQFFDNNQKKVRVAQYATRTEVYPEIPETMMDYLTISFLTIFTWSPTTRT